MKKYFLIVLAFGVLAGCAVTPQQAAQMNDYTLCTFPRQDQATFSEIQDRELNCKKVVRENDVLLVQAANPTWICYAWYNKQSDPNIDLVNKEVKKRSLDCPDIVARDQQLQLMQQQAQNQAIANQLNAAAEESRRNTQMMINAAQPSPQVNCFSTTFGNMTNTHCQ